MTIGNDYAIKYPALKPSEAERSIVELVEEERLNGYTNMTDSEIANLIAYKEKIAKQDAVIEEMKTHNKIIQEQMKASAQQQLEQSREFFNKVLSMNTEFISVTGNEVE